MNESLNRYVAPSYAWSEFGRVSQYPGGNPIMPDRKLNLFKEWRTADRDAHGIEQAVTKASLAALDGRGQPPAESEIATARKLRA